MIFHLNWIWLFSIILFAGFALIFIGNKKKNLNILQWGYFLALASFFVLLSVLKDFTTSMFFLVLVTGICWAIERYIFNKKKLQPKKSSLAKHFVYYSGEFFPILLVVFLLRAFVVEPFQIPSSSMRPGLVPGDFIMVNKFTYGLRLPILNNVVVPFHEIARGDVVVFNAPMNENINFIKRVIGLPGDIVTYQDKVLLINGKQIPKTPTENYVYPTDDEKKLQYNQQFFEQMDNKSFKTLNNPSMLSVYLGAIQPHRYLKNCRYEKNGRAFVCKVPLNYYFVMGDNRDGSNDSRYWGFVKSDLIVGKAFMIWMNFRAFGRIGTIIE